MSDEDDYEYEYDDDDMEEEFQYTDEEEQADDKEVALGKRKDMAGVSCLCGFCTLSHTGLFYFCRERLLQQQGSP